MHLLSQLEVTGAEVFAATLANEQVATGHQVFIVSDTWHTPTNATVHTMPVHKGGLFKRWVNGWRVRSFIRQHNIQVVHAHSRAASWVGHYATRGSKVAMISHVHGRQHVHSSSKKRNPYGLRALAMCQDVRTHLVTELGLQPDRLHVVPNGFDWSTFDAAANTPGSSNAALRLVIAGRTTGPKGEVTAHFLQHIAPGLLAQNPTLSVELYGGQLNNLPEAGQQAWQRLKSTFGERVLWKGFTTNLPAVLAQAQVVLASGRVAIEALGLGKQVVSAGEWQCHGLVTVPNLELNFASNFGDTGPTLPTPAYDWVLLQSSLQLAINNAQKQLAGDADMEQQATSLSQVIRQRYDIKSVANVIYGHYLSVRAQTLHPRPIPILMYHKVVKEPQDTPHRIFVTEATLRQHFRLLKSKGRQTITFEDYHNWRQDPEKFTLPQNPVILTFDDGYRNNKELLLPLLQEFGFKAVIYPIPAENNFWDQDTGGVIEPLMTNEELRYMVSQGIELGSHGMTHRDLSLPISAAELDYELNSSKAWLEGITAKPVLSFAYPYGRTTDEVTEAVKQHYPYAVLINDGTGMHLEEASQRIFRAYIFPEDNGSKYMRKASWWYRAYFKWKRGR